MKETKRTFSLATSVLYVFIGVSMVLTLYRAFLVIFPRIHTFVDPVYTEKYYKGLENAYNTSQYRVKNNANIIPDETIISYASGAYVRGIDPIFINSEYTPLGKYMIGLSILFLKNDSFPILFFGLLTLIILWMLAHEVFENVWVSLIPVIFLANEQLFLDQFRITPLLDIVQLPFILLALLLFIRENRHQSYVATALCVGVIMGIKTPIAGILLIITFLLYGVATKNIHTVKRITVWMLLSGIPFVMSYAKTFLDGYTPSQFFGFMKWIILYQRSKLEYPLSAWRLVFFNQWQTWWGDRSFLKAVDWQITWPIFSMLTFLVGIFIVMHKLKTFPGLTVLLLWFCVYGMFLSLGVISSRFFLPFFPILYIISIHGIISGLKKFRKN